MSLYSDVKDLEDEVSDVKDEISDIRDWINRTIETTNENDRIFRGDITELEEGIQGVQEELKEIRDEIRSHRFSIWQLRRKQRSDLMDIFQIQEALVEYLNRHPDEYPEVREILQNLIRRVEGRLKKRTKIIKWVPRFHVRGELSDTGWIATRKEWFPVLGWGTWRLANDVSAREDRRWKDQYPTWPRWSMRFSPLYVVRRNAWRSGK